MPGSGDSRPEDPRAYSETVLKNALIYLVATRETVQTQAGNQSPVRRTIKDLAEILAEVDHLRVANLLPRRSVNPRLWGYVGELKELLTREPENVTFSMLGAYLSYIIQAIITTCVDAQFELPRGIALDARKGRRGVVTERISDRPPKS
jgi:hypothetical protein